MDADTTRTFLEGAGPAQLFSLVCGELAVIRGKRIRPTGRDAAIAKTAQALFLGREDAQTLLIKIIVSARSPQRAREYAEALLLAEIEKHGIPRALLDALVTQDEQALTALRRILAALPEAQVQAALLAALKSDKPPPQESGP